METLSHIGHALITVIAVFAIVIGIGYFIAVSTGALDE
jgi:hypothetical protein